MMGFNKQFRSVAALILAGALTTFSTAALAEGHEHSAPRMEFNDAGELLRPDPEVFREWIFVGTNITPVSYNQIEEVAFPGFHNTYMHPDDYAHFVETGEFREGTQFIQENTSAGNKGASGNGFFSGDIWGVKASVKDSERFPDRPGNWGYFKWQSTWEDESIDAASVFPIESCNQCHVDHAAETDYVFMQHYHVLRDVAPE